MNRTEELKALRKSAAALNKSDYEVTRRLENAYDHVTLMLEALHDQSSTQTLMDIDDGITILLERLVDTQTILRLVLRERELENKLAQLEESPLIPEQEPTMASMLLDQIKFGEAVWKDKDGNDIEIDPEILKKIEQRQVLESLVDTLYPSEQAQKIKKILEREELRMTPLTPALQVKIPRPWRDLDASIPTAKGQGYEPPKTPEPK